jgi:hypothetical protein
MSGGDIVLPLAAIEPKKAPDEAPLLCESVAGVLRRLLELVPADRRDPLALALSRSLVEQQERKLAISDGWDTWLSSANRASAPKELTLRNYGAQWRRFAAWAAGRDLRWFHEIDEAAVLAYADDLWASRITARTFNAHLQFLRSVWATLRVTAGLAADNPWSTLKSKAAGPDAGRRDLTLVQKTLGHSTAGMTAHYTHTDTASARQVLAPLAEIMTGNHTAAL